MKRGNHKRKNRAPRVRFFLKICALVASSVFIALFHVWQYVQMAQTGFRLKKEEKRLIQLQKEKQGLQLILSKRLMPSQISKQVDQLGLALKQPKKWQIVRVKSRSIFFDGGALSVRELEEEGIFGKTLISVSAIGPPPNPAMLDEER